jgi:hypothetical protein
LAGCSAATGPRGGGEAIFVGKEPLKGTIRGHQSSLPPDVVRCSNCHAAPRQERSALRSAPQIDRSLLVEPRERRGGPPSSYDAPSFCRLLRTGIDPAYVLIARVMPTYELNDAQCSHLWQFLTE